MQKFVGIDIEEVKEKWLDGKDLTVEEVSGLLGLLEARDDVINAIKDLVENEQLSKSETVDKIASLLRL